MKESKIKLKNLPSKWILNTNPLFNTHTLGTFDEHELPGAGILPSLWFYWYSLVYQPPVFRFDIRMILWHHGGFLMCFGCLHHQGGHRGHRRQQGRHDGAWWRGGLVYHFQNDSLTLRRLPDMSRMSPSPRWTTRASSSARSTWWSMGAGWSSFSSRGYCWQHQTCTRVFKTIFFCLDYFLCQEVCLDINQTDLQDWGCFDWCLNQSHQSITCCSPASGTWPGLTDASPRCWCSPAGRKWGNYSISKILFWK